MSWLSTTRKYGGVEVEITIWWLCGDDWKVIDQLVEEGIKRRRCPRSRNRVYQDCVAKILRQAYGIGEKENC